MKKDKKIKEMTETATQRSNVYGLLATIFQKELTPALLKQIKNPAFLNVLTGQGVKLGDDILKKPDDELIEDLAIEYTRLFLGPDKHISPHESVHHETGDGDWGTLWGRSTVEVKKFIEATGLKYTSDYTGIPDHISVELEFMQQLTRREAQAWEKNDNNGALYCLKIEKKFLDEHLAGWIPVFCDKIVSEAELSFYREMAKLTKSFIELEKKEINDYLAEGQKVAPPPKSDA